MSAAIHPLALLRPALLVFLLLPFMSLTSAAQTDCSDSHPGADGRRDSAPDISADCVADGTLEFGLAIGAGYAGNPLADGDDVKLPLLPRVSYYNEHFFIESTTFGYTAWESARQRFNFIAKPNLDYVFFSQSGNFSAALVPPFWLPRENPPKLSLGPRRLTYLGGLEYSAFFEHWQLQTSVAQDISVGHNGVEANLGLKYLTKLADYRIEAAAGVLYRDEKLTDYYYGVHREETAAERWVYRPGASLSPWLNLQATRKLSEHTGFLALLSAQYVDNVIAESQLVSERLWLGSFVGITYDF